MPAPYLVTWNERLALDPYATSDLVASEVVGEIPADFGGIDSDRLFLACRNVLQAMHRVSLHWTPERLERQAEHRATDRGGPTTIAREAWLFRAFYCALVEGFVSGRGPASGKHTHGIDLQMQLQDVIPQLRHAVEFLERQAAAVEARATDLRLRYEFEKLRAVVSGREIASEIATLIERATRDSDLEAHLLDVREALAGIGAKLDETRADVSFVADLATEQLGRDLAPAAAKVARKLCEDAPAAIIEQLLLLIAHSLAT